MKKFIITAVLTGLIGGAAFAATTNVVNSANVVGYIQVVDPASNRYVLISAPFNSGTGTVSTLLDIFGTNQLRKSDNATRCDKVIAWDTVQQKYIQYVQQNNGTFHYFTNFLGAAVNPAVTRGQALWLLSPSATYAPTNQIVYISGDVPNDGAYTNSIAGGTGKPFSFIANPYPVEMDINSLINTNDGAIGSGNNTKADKIMLWDNDGQKYITLSLRVAPSDPSLNNKWLYFTNFVLATSAPAIKVQPGQGFWYQTTNAFTWIEPLTYTNAFN